MRRLSSSRFWLTALGIVILIVGLSIAYDLRTRTFESEAAHYHIVGDQVDASQSADTKEDAEEQAQTILVKMKVNTRAQASAEAMRRHLVL